MKVVSYLCSTAGLLGKVVYVTYEVHMCPYANKRRGKNAIKNNLIRNPPSPHTRDVQKKENSEYPPNFKTKVKLVFYFPTNAAQQGKNVQPDQIIKSLIQVFHALLSSPR